jgi:hypothetical protein
MRDTAWLEDSRYCEVWRLYTLVIQSHIHHCHKNIYLRGGKCIENEDGTLTHRKIIHVRFEPTSLLEPHGGVKKKKVLATNNYPTVQHNSKGNNTVIPEEHFEKIRFIRFNLAEN